MVYPSPEPSLYSKPSKLWGQPTGAAALGHPLPADGDAARAGRRPGAGRQRSAGAERGAALQRGWPRGDGRSTARPAPNEEAPPDLGVGGGIAGLDGAGAGQQRGGEGLDGGALWPGAGCHVGVDLPAWVREPLAQGAEGFSLKPASSLPHPEDFHHRGRSPLRGSRDAPAGGRSRRRSSLQRW